jgi:hypothetical protein
VSCQLDVLKKCKKRSSLVKSLESLPKTLDDTYARILASIEEDYQQEALRALIWLAFSQRPLRIEEVAETAVVDPKRPLHLIRKSDSTTSATTYLKYWVA